MHYGHCFSSVTDAYDPHTQYLHVTKFKHIILHKESTMFLKAFVDYPVGFVSSVCQGLLENLLSLCSTVCLNLVIYNSTLHR